MKQLTFGLVLFSLIFLSCFSVNAGSEIQPLVSPPYGCGMSVYLLPAKPPALERPELVAFQELDDATPKPIQMDFGQGQKLLPFISKNKEYPEKVGDEIVLAFGDKSSRVYLNLKLIGFCSGMKSLDDGCEVQNFTGNLTLSTKEGTSVKDIMVDKGC